MLWTLRISAVLLIALVIVVAATYAAGMKIAVTQRHSCGDPHGVDCLVEKYSPH